LTELARRLARSSQPHTPKHEKITAAHFFLILEMCPTARGADNAVDCVPALGSFPMQFPRLSFSRATPLIIMKNIVSPEPRVSNPKSRALPNKFGLVTPVTPERMHITPNSSAGCLRVIYFFY
jgi:hypothetical protein